MQAGEWVCLCRTPQGSPPLCTPQPAFSAAGPILSVPLCSGPRVPAEPGPLCHVPTKHSHDPTKNRLDGSLAVHLAHDPRGDLNLFPAHLRGQAHPLPLSRRPQAIIMNVPSPCPQEQGFLLACSANPVSLLGPCPHGAIPADSRLVSHLSVWSTDEGGQGRPSKHELCWQKV